jgi:hypothetical protein
MNKTLEFSLQEYVKIYAHHSLPVSVLLADQKNISWLNEHFVQLYSYQDSDKVFRIDYIEYYLNYREVLDIILISYEKAEHIETINEFIINAINSNLCVSIYVDEYYLRNKGLYNQSHYVRQLLIIGYDTDARVFTGIGYTKYIDRSLEGSGYDKLEKEEIAFDELKTAYDEARIRFKADPKEYISLIGPKKNAHEYCFKIDRFLDRLDSYLNNKGFRPLQLAMGHSVYATLENALMSMINDGDEKVDSRAFFILHEHKKLLAKSFEYIMKKYDLPANTLLADYQSNVVNRAQMLFYQFLRFEYKEIKYWRLIDDEKHISVFNDSAEKQAQIRDLTKIIESVKKFAITDKLMTTAIFDELKNQFKQIKTGAEKWNRKQLQEN